MTVTSDAPEPALSVRQVLALERVLAGEPEVVAGASHLDRPVRWVHVAEAADVGVMLSGGEMVLTTGVLLAGVEEYGDNDFSAPRTSSIPRPGSSARWRATRSPNRSSATRPWPSSARSATAGSSTGTARRARTGH